MSNETSSSPETLPERQQIERMLRVRPLTISAVYKMADKVGQGYVLNLSHSGVFLSSDVGFEMGDQFRLRFFLPFQLGQVDARVRVKWRTQDVENPPQELGTGFGLEFIEIESEMQDKISLFIEKFVEFAEQLKS